jgi:hypothetical protein
MTENQDVKKVERWANVRLSEKEHRALDVVQKRLQTTRSRLLRKMIRELIGMGPDLLTQEWEVLERLIYQLAALGRNLNQYLKAIHTGQAMATPPDLALIQEVRDQVNRVDEEVVTIIARSWNRWVKMDDALFAFRSGRRLLQANGTGSAFREGTTP